MGDPAILRQEGKKISGIRQNLGPAKFKRMKGERDHNRKDAWLDLSAMTKGGKKPAGFDMEGIKVKTILMERRRTNLV